MATIQPVAEIFSDGGGTIFRVTWAHMGNDDVGAPVRRFGAADRSAQVVGALSGGTAYIRGSNDETNFPTLHDPQGVALSYLSEDIRAIAEACVAIYPEIVGGDGSTDVTVIIAMKVSPP
jgi:hypothetical protein